MPEASAKPEAADKKVPPQWAVRDLRGPKGEVIGRIQSDANIPDFVKSFLVSAVKASGAAGVRVDCHGFHPDADNLNQTVTIAKLY